MKKQITILIAFFLAFSMGAYAQNKHSVTTKYPTYKGLVMAGYQGWFIQRDGQMHPDAAKIRIDMWPDMREYEKAYPTGLKYADGSTATFFSATDKSTIDLHFKWMKQYGIDGVFMQRFFNYTKPGPQRNTFAGILRNALEAASKYERAIAVMYDLSGLKASGEDCSTIIEDWKFLVDSLNVTNQKGTKTYLFHRGKPVVVIWGIGFPDRPYNIRNIGLPQLLNFLKNDPVYGGCTVMLGVPTYFRELDPKDCITDPYLHEIIKMADIVSPWMVGRFKEDSYDAFKENIPKDIAWCKQNNLDYVPVVWPGFSWHNLSKKSLSNATPRNGGSFFWKQIYNSINLGAEMLYIAMFDEVNESTAIFKCTDNPPVSNDAIFINMEGKPSDHYLWLTGEGAKMLRKEKPLSFQMPKRD